MSNNIGLMYYKDYFLDLEFDTEGEPHLTCYNSSLLNLKFESYKEFSPKNNVSTQSFNLITTYPGLLIGLGYAHEIGGKTIVNELKLGFFFDHTTGLPCIPGSSVKGVLRDACEKVGGKYIELILKELAEGKRKSNCKDVATKFVESSLGSILYEKDKTSDFVNHVFEGINIPIYKRDIFFDVFPIHSLNDGDKFLANDYITHHENPLKNPNPVQFLKVLPNVVFRFEFKLTDEIMPALLKREFFKQILLDLGIGAKTNVGYGQFKDETVPQNGNAGGEGNGQNGGEKSGREDKIPPQPKNIVTQEWITAFGEYKIYDFDGKIKKIESEPDGYVHCQFGNIIIEMEKNKLKGAIKDGNIEMSIYKLKLDSPIGCTIKLIP